MATITSVSIDAVAYAILPGTLKFRAEPKVHIAQNEPTVTTGFNWVVLFELDVANIASLVSTVSGGVGSTLIISGFPTVYTAMVDVGYAGAGIQKVPVKISGTGTVA